VNTPELFAIGGVVTFFVVIALALLIYGAILDGRDNQLASQRADESQDPAGLRSDPSAGDR
jgi:hypothetical protein